MWKKRIYQVFDKSGNAVEVLSARSVADAARKARELNIDFPILVEVPRKIAKEMRRVLEHKKALEDFICSMTIEQVQRFEENTGVKVSQVNIQYRNRERGATA